MANASVKHDKADFEVLDLLHDRVIQIHLGFVAEVCYDDARMNIKLLKLFLHDFVELGLSAGDKADVEAVCGKLAAKLQTDAV